MNVDEVRSEIMVRISRLKTEREAKAVEAQRLDYGYAAVIGELEKMIAMIDDSLLKVNDLTD